ncbi:hypothetical protein [Pedobacter changchengzhani]|uniref:hypothetical protein n=1 Tax=Pedobacter changchengzhani TaxID=2529274 RepID=UPI0014054BE5|nr:hypothetical protein [Pedobacter changchengzhani]
MKKTILTLSLLLLIYTCYSQKIYQCGAFSEQSLRPGSIKLKGKLIDKYFNKGFYWFTVLENKTTYKIIMADNDQFKNCKIDSIINLEACFEISSNKWKKKTD